MGCVQSTTICEIKILTFCLLPRLSRAEAHRCSLSLVDLVRFSFKSAKASFLFLVIFFSWPVLSSLPWSLYFSSLAGSLRSAKGHCGIIEAVEIVETFRFRALGFSLACVRRGSTKYCVLQTPCSVLGTKYFVHVPRSDV